MENILKSPVPKVRLPEGGLYPFIHAKLLEFGPQLALVDSTSGKQLTFYDVLVLVERVTYHLLRQGVSRGDVFALCAPNSTTYVLVELALARLGAIFAVLSQQSSPDEMKHMLTLAEAKYLFAGSTQADVVNQIRTSTPVQVVFVDGSEHTSSLFNPIPSGQVAPPVTTAPSDDVCGILYSSGTSGLPKAVEYTHRGFLAQALLAGPTALCPSRGEGCLLYLPLSHLFGYNLLLGTLATGAYSVIMPRFNLDIYLQLVVKYKIKRLHLVPPILVLLTKSPLVNNYDISCVEELVVGAAPVSAELEQEAALRLGHHVCIRQAYGMTEICGLITITPSLSKQKCRTPSGSVGVMAPNIALKVVDTATGEALGAHKTGELQLKADHMMKGYKHNAKGTRESIGTDGWLRTGDVGYCDEHGHVFVVDRIKELIKYNAYQVPPAELEGLLLTHPGVADVGVIGLPDKAAGELPHAWVVRKPGSSVTEEDILSFVADRVAPYKKLRGGVKFVAEIPKTSSGKILHRLMRLEMKKMAANL